jgi:hypothetical protein
VKVSHKLRYRVGFLVVVFLSLVTLSCQKETSGEVKLPTTQVKADLETLAKARIFFGHQSVGGNILQGLHALSETVGVPLRIVEISALPPDSGAGIFHAKVGSNEAPVTKCEAFSGFLNQPVLPYYDLAVLKFCFVDLDEGSHEQSARELVERYQKTLADIHDQHPELAIVYTTVPLEADPPGWKTRLKRLLGLATWKDLANRRRNEYNGLIRTRYAGPQLLDIAKIESTYPNGRTSAFGPADQRVATLAPIYTTDGGHLNALGQQQVAVAFAHTLAETLRSQAKLPLVNP